MHSSHTYHEQTICSICYTVPSYESTDKVYTQKDLVLLETSIAEFYEMFYILDILKLEFHLPHVRILETHQYSKERHGEFKRHGNLHDVYRYKILLAR